MAFELEAGESVAVGIRRIVDEQLQSALDELRRADDANADEAVHAARKRLKRVRAVARLVRDELGESVFAQANASFRDAAARLAEARDAAVLVKTLDSLEDKVADREAFAAARQRLDARRTAVSRRGLEQGDGLETVARAVEQAGHRVAVWPIDRDGWRALRPGLRRVYARGRRAHKLAEIDAPADLFHEWRKQVKHLWHHLEVLEPVWPPVMKKLADECHRLADLLGDDHDLAVLRETLEPHAAPDCDGRSPVTDAARAVQGQLRRDARALGARVYADKPKAFVRRLGEYWKAWRDEPSADVPPQSPGVTAAEIPTSAQPAANADGVQEGGGGEVTATAAATPAGNGAA